MMTQNLPTRNGNGRPNPMTTVKNLFESARSKLAQVAPKHVTPDRLMRVALLAISRTPKLAECTPHSLLNSFMTASQLGLEVGGVLGEAYLVPYKQEATFIVGYRGLINLARRSGQIQSVESQVVRDGDEFDFEYGIQPIFRHRLVAPVDSPITHAWALARFKDGGHQLDVMTLDEVNAIRSRSRAASNGPWVTDFAEMAKKTVVRRLCKYLPLSPEMADAIEESDRGEFGNFVEGQVIEASETRAAKRKSDRMADEFENIGGGSEPEFAADDSPSPAQAAPLDVVIHAEPATESATPTPAGAGPGSAEQSDPEPEFDHADMAPEAFIRLLRDKAKDHGHALKATFEGGMFKYAQRAGVGDIKRLESGERIHLYRAVVSNRLDYATGEVRAG